VSNYVRPAVPVQTFRDADGALIEYGARWGSQWPPEGSYSVDSHPERFAPLHQIADALIDHLQRTYDVDVSDDLSCVQDLRHPMEAARAVRLTPAADDAAPLTFVFTSYPGVVVHAGLLHDFLYPTCGCDACDKSLSSVADELERDVQAVVSGRYREEVRGNGGAPWIWYELRAADGSPNGGSGTGATHEAGADLQKAAAHLEGLPNGWVAWSYR
jgi:hypothetical protein